VERLQCRISKEGPIERDQEIDTFGCGEIADIPFLTVVGAHRTGKTFHDKEATGLRANKMKHLAILLAKERMILRFHMDDGSGNHSLCPLSLLSFSGPLSLLKQRLPEDSFFKKRPKKMRLILKERRDRMR
jgi:hypothetical protein